MAKKGRPKGQQSKRCLIEDEVLSPFEVHVDKYNYILVNGKTEQVEGYYTSLAHCLKAVLKTKYVPNDGSGKTFTIKGYIEAMQSLNDEMAELLIPAHHKI